MPCPRPDPAAHPRPGRPAFEVADVFRAHGETFRQRHRLSGDQQKVMRAIETCRTSVLGGHVDVCPDCDYRRISYNSCRNRHCPKCQALPQARWIEARMERILPVEYFHVVFTLPAQLRSLALRNRKPIFTLLFRAASQTLLDLGDDPDRLGAQLGITCVLHTWTRELTFHPHVHCIVTGGGLSPSGEHWIPARTGYLFPVKVLGRLFRGKFLDGLRALYDAGRLDDAADAPAFARLLHDLYRTDWVVYSKPPFAGPEHVYRYLGRYTHRVGLSNQRIQAIDSDGVTFATKSGRSLTLPHHEFMRRFLLHVLPSGFVKIRHFGLHSPRNAKTKLVRARTLIQAGASNAPATATHATDDAPPAPRTWQQLLFDLTGVDPSLCPDCGSTLRTFPFPRCRNALIPVAAFDTS